MDGPRGYYAKWDKSERQIPYNFIYMWKLKIKTNEQMQQNRNRVIDRESKQVVAQGEKLEGGKKNVREIKRYKLPVAK